MLQCREVTLQSQSRDASNCSLRRQALTSEWLSAVNVREVHLNRGMFKDATASLTATEVWLNPPGLKITAWQVGATCCKMPTKSPSTLL